MCQSYTFYNLCGHVFTKTIISCPDAIQQLILLFPRTRHSAAAPTHSLCTDTVEELEIVPTLCEACRTVGQISELFAQTPQARFDAVRSWKAEVKRMKTTRSMKASIDKSLGDDSNASLRFYSNIDAEAKDREAISDAESMPFINTTETEATDEDATNDAESMPFLEPSEWSQGANSSRTSVTTSLDEVLVKSAKDRLTRTELKEKMTLMDLRISRALAKTRAAKRYWQSREAP